MWGSDEKVEVTLYFFAGWQETPSTAVMYGDHNTSEGDHTTEAVEEQMI